MEPEHAVEAYNGMSAWGQNPAEGAKTLTGEAAKEAEAVGRYWNGRLVDVKKDKLNVQLLGVEKVRGRDAYHVRVLFAPGIVREVYIDTQTHLITRETTPQSDSSIMRTSARSANPRKSRTGSNFTAAATIMRSR